MANSITSTNTPGPQLSTPGGAATILTSDIAVKQLSDSNGAGTVLGSGPSDLVGFYGATPVPQPSSALQGSINQNAGGGVVTVFTTTQTPSSVATITVAEQAITPPAVPAMFTTDLIIVNKPTVDAGIGLCMSRVSTATSVALAFANVTAGTLTPASAQAYLLTTIGTNLQTTAVLTPSPVAAATVVEQTFNVAGIGPGMIVQVNKPATQAGLGVLSARGVSDGVLAITYINPTAAVLTPTAAETYKIVGLTGLVPGSQLIQYGIAIGTTTVTANTTAEKVLTEATLLGTDIWVGATKPTVQAGIGLLGGRVSPTAGQAYVTIGNFTAGTLTPTTTELYGVTVFRPNPAAVMSVFSATITPASVAANTSAEQTFTVTGLVSGDPVAITPQGNVSQIPGVGIAGVRASATNTIAICFINATTAAIVPPVLPILVAQFNIGAPTAGNSVSQTVDPVQTSLVNDAAAIRSALVTTGLFKGA